MQQVGFVNVNKNIFPRLVDLFLKVKIFLKLHIPFLWAKLILKIHFCDTPNITGSALSKGSRIHF